MPKLAECRHLSGTTCQTCEKMPTIKFILTNITKFNPKFAEFSQDNVGIIMNFQFDVFSFILNKIILAGYVGI